MNSDKKEVLKTKYIKLDMAKANISYGGLYLVMNMISSIILLALLLLGIFDKVYPFPMYHYICLYSVSIIVPLILLIIGKNLKKDIPGNTKKIMVLSSIIVAFTSLWSACLAALAIFEGSTDIFNILTALLYVLVLPMILYSPFIVYSMCYGFHFIAIVVVGFIYANNNMVWICVNMVIFYFFAILVVYIRNRAKRETVTTQRLSKEEIENQKLLNQRMVKLVDELRIVSITDRLTGLYNRVFLDETANQIWEESMQAKEMVVVVMIDIDDFKAINDTFGHTAGDSCLRRISDLIKEYAISNNGLAFRYGGEEFLIIYKGYNVATVKGFMNDLRESTEQIVIPKYNDVTMNISLGIAGTIPNGKNDFYEIVTEADKLLYKEKTLKGHGIKKYKRE